MGAFLFVGSIKYWQISDSYHSVILRYLNRRKARMEGWRTTGLHVSPKKGECFRSPSWAGRCQWKHWGVNLFWEILTWNHSLSLEQTLDREDSEWVRAAHCSLFLICLVCCKIKHVRFTEFQDFCSYTGRNTVFIDGLVLLPLKVVQVIPLATWDGKRNF